MRGRGDLPAGRARARAFVSMVVVSWLTLATLFPAVSAQEIDIARLLDRYAAADYDAAQVPGTGEPDRFLQAVERHGERWISAGDDMASRRLIAAAFALEPPRACCSRPDASCTGDCSTGRGGRSARFPRATASPPGTSRRCRC